MLLYHSVYDNKRLDLDITIIVITKTSKLFWKIKTMWYKNLHYQKDLFQNVLKEK